MMVGSTPVGVKFISQVRGEVVFDGLDLWWWSLLREFVWLHASWGGHQFEYSISFYLMLTKPFWAMISINEGSESAFVLCIWAIPFLWIKPSLFNLRKVAVMCIIFTLRARGCTPWFGRPTPWFYPVNSELRSQILLTVNWCNYVPIPLIAFQFSTPSLDRKN